MAYLLLIVRQGEDILGFAAYDRNLARVEFDESTIGIALRRDPCLKMRQLFAIKSTLVYLDGNNPTTQPGRILVPVVYQDGTVTGLQQNRHQEENIVCMNEISFMHLCVEMRTRLRYPADIAYCCFNEFTKSDRFRLNCVHFFEEYAKWKDTSDNICRCYEFHLVVNYSLKVAFVIEISAKNCKPTVNYAWCGRMLSLVRKREQLEETMAWLSTLGGGFSALGDYFTTFSEKAGCLSMTQLRVAIEMGDPIMAAKCRLFYALSLMQRDMLRTSKTIIRMVYNFATHFKIRDQKLLDMCHGMWNKLRFYYQKKARRKTNGYHHKVQDYNDNRLLNGNREKSGTQQQVTRDGWIPLRDTCSISIGTQTDLSCVQVYDVS